MSSEVVTPDDEEIRCHSCLDDEYVGCVVLVLSGGVAIVAMTNEFLMTMSTLYDITRKHRSHSRSRPRRRCGIGTRGSRHWLAALVGYVLLCFR